MILPEISSILTASTYFVAAPSSSGVQVWMSNAPDASEDTALIVIESPGAPPEYDYSGIEFNRPRIQVVARSSAYATAVTVADKAFALLSTVENSTRYITITPLQYPFDLGQDAKGREQRVCNYALERKTT